MKSSILAIIIAVSLIAVVLMVTKSNPGNNQPANIDNVKIVDGKQIIEIQAKGGYWPRKSVAKAGIPTIVRFDTKGTFDCSASVRIPSINFNKILPQTGVTDVDLGVGQTGTLQGSCGMGMYPFEIEFQI